MRYKIRVKRHKFNQKLVASILKRMALRIIRISNLNGKDDEGHYRCLEITYHPDGYDAYTSCKSWEKDYCGNNKYKYVAYIGGYSFYGKTLVEMYCHIICRLLIDAPQFPFCTSKVLPQKLKIQYRKQVKYGKTNVLLPTDKNFNIISK